jgi:hypothetical protein
MRQAAPEHGYAHDDEQRDEKESDIHVVSNERLCGGARVRLFECFGEVVDVAGGVVDGE